MTKKKTLTYTFHYWGAFCRGAYVRGDFCPRPDIYIYENQKIYCALNSLFKSSPDKLFYVI